MKSFFHKLPYRLTLQIIERAKKEVETEKTDPVSCQTSSLHHQRCKKEKCVTVK